ncbi:pyridoxine/pyridoxamine 5'-phosphate oxidase [Sphaeroforma arctica JP610]|uniref:pyridoxal 5'-phosphate synthase n=1 Tax=Sphaeroforma arctica JP610 TaxID=667725 RepID=A0A0L0FZH0_9EUKA|nr:pyridoxine/pyridoxamine 5'-phosphate oxidase [Sphaeroforma arctica JP610]KNC82227.1 pyridoxine/pyridoxamine 5'-phosphate oxidase [Sphaeroforma arctica JP610]|eukprot:XP_014156129.1 pyridoxine/pyridoxamine 5'-phosphate oxidase [Sphaeroforma arctica JP610]
MTDDRDGIFSGDCPVGIVRRWLAEAVETEPEEANAIALATVDSTGLPNVRMVLLKEIEDNAFIFYTNYTSKKAQEIDEPSSGDRGISLTIGDSVIPNSSSSACKAAFVMHWKSLHRQVRVRGLVSKVESEKSEAYFASRARDSRVGAWASYQSQPLRCRDDIEARIKEISDTHKEINRPNFWGGYRIKPLEIELWANGPNRVHDRFQWRRDDIVDRHWRVQRLNP